MTLYVIFIFNLLWPLAMQVFFHQTITLRELALTIALTMCMGAISWGIGTSLDKYDVEVVSGQVVSKLKEEVSCGHSYECFCYDSCSTDSNGNQSCTRICQTCYEHDNDYDWDVKSTIGNFTIDRIDRQGVDEPPRWTAVRANDPVADTRKFINYVKIAPNSLFNNLKNVQALPYVAQIPEYPADIYDYYRINRALTSGIAIPDLAMYSSQIEMTLRTLGAQKQVNYILVFVPATYSQAYAETLKVKWLGGKKNDVIVIAAFDKYPTTPVWVQVVSWTDSQLFKVKLRDRLKELPVWTPTEVLKVMKEETVAGFNRKQFSDFKNLEKQYRPSTTVIWVTFFLMLLCNIGLTWFFHKNETV